MAEPMEDTSKSDPRNYFAAERTFLAWIRTGLALMGFGFVVARFGLFLQELQLVAPNLRTKSYGFSLWTGTAFIGIGVLVNVISALQHVRLVRRMNEGLAVGDRPSSLGIAVALVLAIMGLAMAIFLISVRGSN